VVAAKIGAAGGDDLWDVSNWPVVLLVIIAVLLFRRQGDSWLVTLAKLFGLVALVLITVLILGGVIAWLS
jgi:hypothetical protein